MAAIVIEMIDVPARMIEFALQPGALLRRDLTIRFGRRFIAVDPGLFALQPCPFSRCQTARFNTLSDAILLLAFTMVDARRARLGHRAGGKSD